MRIEYARAKKSKAGLMGAMVALALAAGTLLATGDTPTKHNPSSVGKSEAFAAATTDRISPREAIADRDCLDLQLD